MLVSYQASGQMRGKSEANEASEATDGKLSTTSIGHCPILIDLGIEF